jgi:hypothetical protein
MNTNTFNMIQSVNLTELFHVIGVMTILQKKIPFTLIDIKY